MLTLRTRVNFRSRVVIKCEKHPRYNPEKQGKGAIIGNCSRCNFIYQIFATQQTMLNALRDYQQLTQSFEQIQPRPVKSKESTT